MLMTPELESETSHVGVTFPTQAKGMTSTDTELDLYLPQSVIKAKGRVFRLIRNFRSLTQ